MNLKIQAKLDPTYQPMALVCRDFEARAKAEGAEELVIGVARTGDYMSAYRTVVFANGKILGKPKDRAEGEQMLLDLSGKMHTVYTGLTVADKTGTVTDVSATDVYFKKLTKNDIEKYLDTNEYKDKAGAYGIQGYAARFVEKIHGCYFNVVGLPLSLLDKI